MYDLYNVEGILLYTEQEIGDCINIIELNVVCTSGYNTKHLAKNMLNELIEYGKNNDFIEIRLFAVNYDVACYYEHKFNFKPKPIKNINSIEMRLDLCDDEEI